MGDFSPRITECWHCKEFRLCSLNSRDGCCLDYYCEQCVEDDRREYPEGHGTSWP